MLIAKLKAIICYLLRGFRLLFSFSNFLPDKNPVHILKDLGIQKSSLIFASVGFSSLGWKIDEAEVL
jgi:hypothetical protein